MQATITTWNPEDALLWEQSERGVAYRNLWISIPALFLAFVVWMVWSVTVVNLPTIGFQFTTSQLFWLTAIPGLSGATLRIFYSFMVPIFGGRNWTALSTASLLIPMFGIAWFVQDVSTPYWVFALLALLAGLGGGNFASSMANINFFFPKGSKGIALGLNAGIGNLGVSAVQFIVPLVIGSSLFGSMGGASMTSTTAKGVREIWLQNAAIVWIPLIAIVALAAWLGMNNLATAKASFRDQSIIFKRRHTWIMSALYIGTFGSFIGYSAAFPLLIKTLFPQVPVLSYAFLGPLVGAVVRPIGGWLSDRLGGARVTFWTFVLLAIGVAGVIWSLVAGVSPDFTLFFASFLILFLATGIGNGSTFRMIPVIFRTERFRDAGPAADADVVTRQAEKESAATLGFSSAMGAYGAFLIPLLFNASISWDGTAIPAMIGLGVFYLACVATTWWYYSRRGAEVPC